MLWPGSRNSLGSNTVSDQVQRTPEGHMSTDSMLMTNGGASCKDTVTARQEDKQHCYMMIADQHSTGTWKSHVFSDDNGRKLDACSVPGWFVVSVSRHFKHANSSYIMPHKQGQRRVLKK